MASSAGSGKDLLPRSGSRTGGHGIVGLQTVFVSRRRTSERRNGDDRRNEDGNITTGLHLFPVPIRGTRIYSFRDRQDPPSKTIPKGAGIPLRPLPAARLLLQYTKAGNGCPDLAAANIGSEVIVQLR